MWPTVTDDVDKHDEVDGRIEQLTRGVARTIGDMKGGHHRTDNRVKGHGWMRDGGSGNAENIVAMGSNEVPA